MYGYSPVTRGGFPFIHISRDIKSVAPVEVSSLHQLFARILNRRCHDGDHESILGIAVGH